jgi:hypothetical protein
MFPISSTNTPAYESLAIQPTTQPVAPTPVTDASGVTRSDATLGVTALPQPSTTVDLSPVARFSSSVSQAQQQLNQLQAAVANGAEPLDTAEQQSRLSDVAQNLVDAFNLLPAVDFNQGQPQNGSLLNSLVQSLTQQNGADNATQGSTLAQDLTRLGVTLQAPLLSDAAGGLSLDSEILRAAFNTDRQATASTLQQTVATFGRVTNEFAQQVSAAATSAVGALAFGQQPALTAADIAANLRLDAARVELEQLALTPRPDTGADRLNAQRAEQDQLGQAVENTPLNPIANGAGNANNAAQVGAQTAATLQGNQAVAGQQANQASASQQAAQAPTAAQQANQAPASQQTGQASAAQPAAGQTTAQQQAAAAQDQAATRSASQASDAAAAAAQNAAANLNQANAARAQAASQATIAQNAAAAAANNNGASAGNVAAANAAAASAQAQARAAQAAAASLAADSVAATNAAAQARAAQNAASGQQAINAAAAIAAQQATAAQSTAANLAVANAAAAAAAQAAQSAQAAAATAAAQQSLTVQEAVNQATAAQQTPAAQDAANLAAAAQQTPPGQADPLRANPALAGAIAAYSIRDGGQAPNGRSAQASAAVPPVERVTPVNPAAAIGAGPR